MLININNVYKDLALTDSVFVYVFNHLLLKITHKTSCKVLDLTLHCKPYLARSFKQDKPKQAHQFQKKPKNKHLGVEGGASRGVSKYWQI